MQPPAPYRSTARPAPFEQLRTFGRELEGGILAFDSGASRWLIDPERSVFQRIAPEMDVVRAVSFGCWEPYASVALPDPETLVIVPAGPHAPLRVQLALPAAAGDHR